MKNPDDDMIYRTMRGNRSRGYGAACAGVAAGLIVHHAGFEIWDALWLAFLVFGAAFLLTAHVP
jgi:predicted branched-subunit amino acid permease